MPVFGTQKIGISSTPASSPTLSSIGPDIVLNQWGKLETLINQTASLIPVPAERKKFLEEFSRQNIEKSFAKLMGSAFNPDIDPDDLMVRFNQKLDPVSLEMFKNFYTQIEASPLFSNDHPSRKLDREFRITMASYALVLYTKANMERAGIELTFEKARSAQLDFFQGEDGKMSIIGACTGGQCFGQDLEDFLTTVREKWKSIGKGIGAVRKKLREVQPVTPKAQSDTPNLDRITNSSGESITMIQWGTLAEKENATKKVFGSSASYAMLEELASKVVDVLQSIFAQSSQRFASGLSDKAFSISGTQGVIRENYFFGAAEATRKRRKKGDEEIKNEFDKTA